MLKILRFLPLIIILFSSHASALESVKPDIDSQKVGIYTVLGTQVDLSLSVTDSEGVTKPVKDFLNPNLPIIMSPMYYGCPRLCGFTIKGIIKLVNELRLKLGEEYQIVTFSIAPNENSKLAAGKKASVTAELLPEPRSGIKHWNFTVTDEQTIKKITDALGFKFVKDGDSDYAHSSGIFILTSSGVVSQFFTGIDFPYWDVKLALVEASKGTIGTAIDHIALFCYRFDPTAGRYTMVAFNSMRIGVFISLAIIGIMLFRFGKKVGNQKPSK